MLSRKYLAIKKLLTWVSKIKPAHRKLIVLAKMYIDIHKGFRFSYISDENGEIEFLNGLHRHYKGTFVFFDVGAHYGTYTDMIVQRFDHYEGHLFDLTETTVTRCVERHGKDPNLVIHHAALSDTAGEIEYRAYPGDPTRNGISGVGAESNFQYELYTAPCWTGDDYSQKSNIKHIDLLKIDAEGYDLHVIKGFDRMLTEGRVDIIQFEYNIKHSETHCMLGDFYNYLESKGYILGVLRQEGVAFRPFDFMMNDFNLGPNYIACRPELRGILAEFRHN
jgi:FkbM family methyltransferase